MTCLAMRTHTCSVISWSIAVAYHTTDTLDWTPTVSDSMCLALVAGFGEVFEHDCRSMMVFVVDSGTYRDLLPTWLDA